MHWWVLANKGLAFTHAKYLTRCAWIAVAVPMSCASKLCLTQHCKMKVTSLDNTVRICARHCGIVLDALGDAKAW